MIKIAVVIGTKLHMKIGCMIKIAIVIGTNVYKDWVNDENSCCDRH